MRRLEQRGRRRRNDKQRILQRKVNEGKKKPALTTRKLTQTREKTIPKAGRTRRRRKLAAWRSQRTRQIAQDLKPFLASTKLPMWTQFVTAMRASLAE